MASQSANGGKRASHKATILSLYVPYESTILQCKHCLLLFVFCMLSDWCTEGSVWLVILVALGLFPWELEACSQIADTVSLYSMLYIMRSNLCVLTTNMQFTIIIISQTISSLQYLDAGGVFHYAFHNCNSKPITVNF